MSLKQQIDQDIKEAMLGGEKVLVTTLRGLKSAIQYVEVAKGVRDEGLSDPEVIEVLSKEAKKRQESADLYVQGGNQTKAQEELVEKEVIRKYLPAQLGEDDIKAAIDKVVTETGAAGPQAMGQVIGAVKGQLGAQADGAVIARLVKERLAQ
jgi:uncharacterized protein YqeY